MGTTSARTSSKYSRCGRTDRGVHAHGQVIALRLRSAFPPGARIASVGAEGEEAASFNSDLVSSSYGMIFGTCAR